MPTDNMQRKQLIIVADDVTGAADSAARVYGAGLTATITVRLDAALPTTAAVALSTDSRFLAPTAAAAQVTNIIRPLVTLVDPAAVSWYKKIDSTLRGNIGAELAAMLAAVTPAGVTPCAIICPAFPAQGRGLVDGTLVYADAPQPAPHLPTLLAEQCALPQAHIALAQVRAGVVPLMQTLSALHQQGVQLLVVDGVTDADLQNLATAAAQLPHALCCGSAGLIGQLALAAASTASPSRMTLPLHRPLLAVIGSGSRMAHHQIAALRTVAELTVVEVAQTHSSAELLATIAPTGDCILHLPPPQPDQPLEGEVARNHVAALTSVALARIAQHQPATLLLVGGDTASHLLSSLGIVRLAVAEELLPGLPLCTALRAQGQPLTVLLKAGNHGDAETLVALYRRMR